MILIVIIDSKCNYVVNTYIIIHGFIIILKIVLQKCQNTLYLLKTINLTSRCLYRLNKGVRL